MRSQFCPQRYAPCYIKDCDLFPDLSSPDCQFFPLGGNFEQICDCNWIEIPESKGVGIAILAQNDVS